MRIFSLRLMLVVQKNMAFYSRIISVAIACILSGCARHTNDSDGVCEKRAQERRESHVKYWGGTLNGAELCVPEYYLFPKKIVYEGDRHDGLDPASAGATEKSRISDFSILVRADNFQPIKTENDRRDWIRSQYVWADSSWLMLDFDVTFPKDRPQNIARIMNPRYGPFSRSKDLSFGLIRYESDQPIDEPEDGSREYGFVEYFFDPKNLTQIKCDTNRTVTKPFRVFARCEHRFFIPELNVMVDTSYSKGNLSRWQEVEVRVRKIANYFIANPTILKSDPHRGNTPHEDQ
jgi:hypothetical protein